MYESIWRLELFTGAGREWTRSCEESAAIVAERDGPGTSISAVARQYGLSTSQLFTWRQLMHQTKRNDGEKPLQFVPAMVSVGRYEPTSAEIGPEAGEQCSCHSIEVEIAGSTVGIAQGASTVQIAAVIRALKACP